MMKKLLVNLKVHTASSGFTLIELLIIGAVIVITLTIAIPTYSNYSIRANIGEALSPVTAVKSATASVCQEGRTIGFLTNQLVGYKFKASKYVKNIVLSGTCNAPTIILTTRATGAKPSPVLTITGDFDENAETITWTCVSSGLDIHVPKSCRS
jgi:type IV pilus assembly protein PilA